jgi:uncharacterized membrane protein
MRAGGFRRGVERVCHLGRGRAKKFIPTEEGSMFGRNRTSGVVADAAGTAAEYGGQLIEDEKVRQRALAAVAAALAARQRARRMTGLSGLARRLATDPVLRDQLTEMVVQLQRAQRRADRKRSHKLRNGILVLAGFGAVTAAVTVPSVRDAAEKLMRRGRRALSTAAGGSAPTAVVDEIEVEVPVTTAYNQWTQFEEFPQFMEGVDEVRQLDDTLLHWAATVAGKRAEWDARIVEQEPDRRISWESTDGRRTRGTVTFEESGPGRTTIHLTMSYVAEGALERAGSAAGLDERRIHGDLERFKELIEGRGVESGAWRGEIHDASRAS